MINVELYEKEGQGVKFTKTVTVVCGVWAAK